MNSISLRNLARRALFAVIWLALALALLFCEGIRFNLTPSLPKGIYRLVSEAPAKSDLVSFCLEGVFAELALERGYLESGSCPSGLRLTTATAFCPAARPRPWSIFNSPKKGQAG